MRLVVSLALMMSLAAPAAPAFAQQLPDPIARSLVGEAAMLAAAHADSDAAADAAWVRLREVAKGTHVVVVLNDGRRLRTHFVDADESSLEVSAPSSRLVRANVLEVREAESRGSVDGAWAGVLGGAAIGVWLTLLASNTQCYPNCGPEAAAIGFSLVGIPVGLGFAGYYGLRHRPEVIYRSN
jgi:hypothetical protein